MIGLSLRNCCEKYNFKPLSLFRGEKHKVGKTYWCSYWQTWYKVIGIDGFHITCEWEDGRVNTHMTTLDVGRDYELVPVDQY